MNNLTDNNFAASVRNVSKRFGETIILEDINFDVSEGESIVLLGASGSGKTTILRIIAGLETPDSGEVILHGRDVTNLPARERGVGVIFQSYALFPKMNVEQNIGYGLRLRGRPKAEVKTKIDELIELVNLQEHRKKFPSQLSGGQQQRVAISRALAYNPEVLLFDEPFSALDAQIRQRLRGEIRTLLKKIKVPAIFITHDQEEALELGDRIAVLNSAKIEQIGTPFDVYNKPETEYVATFLGAANLLLGVIYEGKVSVGNVYINAEEDAKNFRNGQSVKLVFRPEDVCLSKTELPESCHFLAEGFVEETNFVGAFERLSVRLNLAVGLSKNERVNETNAPIIVTRPKPEATAQPLVSEDRVLVGLTSFRILPNFPLATERSGKIF